MRQGDDGARTALPFEVAAVELTDALDELWNKWLSLIIHLL